MQYQTPTILIAASKPDASAALKLTSEDLSLIKQATVSSNVKRNSYRAELKGTFAVKNKWLDQSAASPLDPQAKSSPSLVIHRHTGADDASSALDVISKYVISTCLTYSENWYSNI